VIDCYNNHFIINFTCLLSQFFLGLSVNKIISIHRSSLVLSPTLIEAAWRGIPKATKLYRSPRNSIQEANETEIFGRLAWSDSTVWRQLDLVSPLLFIHVYIYSSNNLSFTQYIET